MSADDPQVTLTVALDGDTWAELQTVALAEDISAEDVVRRLIDMHLGVWLPVPDPTPSDPTLLNTGLADCLLCKKQTVYRWRTELPDGDCESHATCLDETCTFEY